MKTPHLRIVRHKDSDTYYEWPGTGVDFHHFGNRVNPSYAILQSISTGTWYITDPELIDCGQEDKGFGYDRGKYTFEVVR